MGNHPIIDKALEEGWPLTELIDVCEIFGYTLRVVASAETSLNRAVEPVDADVEDYDPDEDVEHIGQLVEEYQHSPDRTGKRWTPMERLQLRNYFLLGVSPSLAADRLNRTPKAIRHQYRKLRAEKERKQDNA